MKLNDRLEFLGDLLSKGTTSTQEELVEKLQKAQFNVTQATVSRDLRKLGVVKVIDAQGLTAYRVPQATSSGPQMKEHILNLSSNGALIVIQTVPGSASLVARSIDLHFKDDTLGTIAGDDTIFVAPKNLKRINILVKRLEKYFNS